MKVEKIEWTRESSETAKESGLPGVFSLAVVTAHIGLLALLAVLAYSCGVDIDLAYVALGLAVTGAIVFVFGIAMYREEGENEDR